MQNINTEQQLTETSELLNFTVHPRTREMYRSNYSAFLAWCVKAHPIVFTNQFLSSIENISSDKLIKNHIHRNIKASDIEFDAITAEIFVEFLLKEKKRESGGYLSFSGYSTHRSSFRALFSNFRREMPNSMEKEIALYFKGLKRKIAVASGAGLGKVKVGKTPLDFELYAFISEQVISSGSTDKITWRTFFLFCWNLMCRADNGVHIHHSHMEWSGDALVVYFSHMKNDQEGTRPKDGRHIFANPLRPSICPILGLAIYWASTRNDPSGKGYLFPGSNQYNRFSKVLSRVLNEDAVLQELTRRGYKVEDFGSHSVRKGSASHAASGSTSCPSATAVCIRAGWSQGPVQDTCLRFQGAGDQFCG